MKQYVLKTNDGETISVTIQLCEEDAIEYFSITKKLPKRELLKIFNIEINEDWNND